MSEPTVDDLDLARKCEACYGVGEIFVQNLAGFRLDCGHNKRCEACNGKGWLPNPATIEELTRLREIQKLARRVIERADKATLVFLKTKIDYLLAAIQQRDAK